jgi:AraC-like DNA-binding protein/quercetin dioxygenase-like cupin family protein
VSQGAGVESADTDRQSPEPAITPQSALQSTLNPDRAPRAALVLAETHPAGDGAWHMHQRVQLIHASRGVLRVSTTHGHWVVPPQRAVWVPAGVRHAVGSARGYQLHTLYVTTSRAPRVAAPAVVAVDTLLGELLKAASALGADYPAQGPGARLMRVLLEQLPTPNLALPALHLPDPQDARLRRLVAPLHRDPADPRSLDALAAEVGLSSRHARRAFVAETGMTPGDWRSRRRLLAALEWLAQGHAVRRVALECGYADPSSFIAVFQRTFGVTPARYFAAHAQQVAAPR